MILKNFNFKKIITWSLIVILAVILELKLGLVFNYKFNFLLGALIAFACFVNYWELIFLNLVGIFLINWKPNLSLEIILLFLIPQFFYLFFKKVKWNNFLALIFFLIFGNILFYGIINYKFLFDYPFYFFYDFIVNSLFGLLSFYFLNFLKYER
jgi:hypothetical protein